MNGRWQCDFEQQSLLEFRYPKMEGDSISKYTHDLWPPLRDHIDRKVIGLHKIEVTGMHKILWLKAGTTGVEDPWCRKHSLLCICPEDQTFGNFDVIGLQSLDNVWAFRHLLN